MCAKHCFRATLRWRSRQPHQRGYEPFIGHGSLLHTLWLANRPICCERSYFCLQFGQYDLPDGLRFRLTHLKWNHIVVQDSESHAIIRPSSVLWHKQYSARLLELASSLRVASSGNICAKKNDSNFWTRLSQKLVSRKTLVTAIDCVVHTTKYPCDTSATANWPCIW